MTFEQANALTGTAEMAMSAAIQIGVQIAQAINESKELAQADKDTLVARIKAAQAAVPVWE
jgi:hypothetical protein